MSGPNGERMVNLSPQERLFAAEVRRAREAAKVSQDWVGRQIGLSRSKVSEVCGGRYLPTRETVALLVEALGMDRDRTLRLWQDAYAARDYRRHQDRQPARPAGWDRLPVLPAEVISLLRAHVHAAEELPYLLPGARRPSLSTVYVRQELGSGSEDSTADRQTPPPRPLAVPAAGGPVAPREMDRSAAFIRSAPPRMAMRPPGRPVREALDGNEHVLVSGGPGQGKSTLTLRLAADIAKSWLGQSEGAETVTEGDPPLAEPVVPIRLPARVLAARIDLPLPDALADAVAAEYGLLLDSPVAAALLAGHMAGCRWLLLIDAVDEIADPHLRARFIRMLAGWVSQSHDGPYRLLVTSRPMESGGLAPLHHGAARFELQSFDAQALRRFADHWFGVDTDDGNRFLRQIRQARLDDLVKVPLLATIAAIIFDQHGDRPLPDNQYDLYQEYLSYLASAHRWPAESGPFAELVGEHRPLLLEHLGATRFHADVSLAEAACDWLQKRTTPQQRPAGWQATLVAILRAVGPLVVRAGDLQFLHHSFAEHLAATDTARHLPAPFDAEHPTWAQTIHAAQHGLTTRFARAVLLHYTHVNVDQADHLITWLHGNSSDYQRIAAELLAQHAPASPAVMDMFLDTARAWARTSSGIEIFRQVSGATHHPHLASWLRELMHEPDAIWSARIEAATVLCTRLGSNVDEAVHLLLTAMDDPALDISDRLAAAQGLAKVGPAQRAVAVRGLREALGDSSSTGYEVREAAVALADLGPECRADAVKGLRATLNDPTAPSQHQVQAAIGLAEIGSEFYDEAVSSLRAIAKDSGVWVYYRTHAAQALGDLGSAHLDQAAHLLDRMVTDHCHTMWDRCRFAAVLAELGPEYAPRAASHLLAMLAEPFITPQDRFNAAGQLAKAHPGYHAAAADHLRQVLADPGLHINSRLWTARALAELGPDYHEEASHELRRVATSPFAEDWEGCDAAAKLASLGPRHRDGAITLLRQKLTDCAVDADIRVSAATELVELGTEFHDEAIAVLSRIAADPRCADRDRAAAAGKLAGLSTASHARVVNVLLTILRNPTTHGAARQDAANHLASLGPAYRAEAVANLTQVLWDRSCPGYDRVQAAKDLAELSREHHAEAISGLRAMLEHTVGSLTILQVASALNELGVEFRSQAAEMLHTIVLSPVADPDQRLAAASALANLGQERRGDIKNGLHAILSDRAADARCRQQAAQALLRHDSEDHVTASVALLAELRNPTCPHWTRQAAAEALAPLGGRHLRDTIDSLRDILAEPTMPAQDRAPLAEVLAALGSAQREFAVSELRAMIANPGTDVPGRLEAVWQLSRMDSAYRNEAMAYLTTVVAADAVSTANRCRAAEHLVRLDQRTLAPTALMLKSLMVSPLAKPADRLLLVEQLTKLAAINRHEWIQIVQAVAADPTATGADRREVNFLLARPKYALHATALELQRDLLNDHLAPVAVRVVRLAIRHGVETPLDVEKLAALHEVLSAPEFDTEDRVQALEALAHFGPEARREAAGTLRQIAENQDTPAKLTYRALSVLGRIDGRHRLEALEAADGIAAQPARHPRQRFAAARAMIKLGGSGASAVDLLRQVLSDPAACDRDRVRAAAALAESGQTDRDEALNRLHDLVHDRTVTPHVRQLAAAALVRWRPTERAAIAQVLDQLAGSGTTPPAARWRLAGALGNLGGDSQDRAVAHLRAIMNEPALRPSARIEAAHALVGIHPRHLDEAADTLRGIVQLSTAAPADRRRAMVVLGSFGRPFCDEAVVTLRGIIHDDTHTPATRWRAARAMVQLRRDTGDDAALVLHAIMRSPDTPGHISQRAARVLAKLSPLYRVEARLALRTP